MKPTDTPLWRATAILLLSAVLLSGCWDRREINDVAFVMVTGFDLARNGGYKESVLIALPGQMGGPGSSAGGGGTSGKEPYYVDTDVGVDFRSATDHLQFRMPRRLNFSHRRVVVVGEALARRSIQPVFDTIARVPQTRPTAYLVIAKGEASNLINARPHMERFSGEAIREIINLNPIGRMNLKRVAQRLNVPGIDPVIPVFETVKNKGGKPQPEVQAAGMALFSGDKLVKITAREEIAPVLWTIGMFYPHTQTVMVNGRPISIAVERGKQDLKVEKTGQRLRFQLNIAAEGNVSEDLASGDLMEQKNVQAIEKAWQAALTQQLKKTVALFQQVRCDAIGSGLALERTIPDEWQKRRDHWQEEFARSQFDVRVSVKVRRVGLITNNLSKQLEVE